MNLGMERLSRTFFPRIVAATATTQAPGRKAVPVNPTAFAL